MVQLTSNMLECSRQFRSRVYGDPDYARIPSTKQLPGSAAFGRNQRPAVGGHRPQVGPHRFHTAWMRSVQAHVEPVGSRPPFASITFLALLAVRRRLKDGRVLICNLSDTSRHVFDEPVVEFSHRGTQVPRMQRRTGILQEGRQGTRRKKPCLRLRSTALRAPSRPSCFELRNAECGSCSDSFNPQPRARPRCRISRLTRSRRQGHATEYRETTRHSQFQ
jgi:hypothetical protein